MDLLRRMDRLLLMDPLPRLRRGVLDFLKVRLCHLHLRCLMVQQRRMLRHFHLDLLFLWLLTDLLCLKDLLLRWHLLFLMLRLIGRGRPAGSTGWCLVPRLRDSSRLAQPFDCAPKHDTNENRVADR